MIKQHPLHCGLKRAAIFCIVTLFALTSRAQEPQIISQLSDDPDCKVWVDSVLSTLSIKEQLGQLMIYTLTPQDTKSNQALLKKVVKEYGVGGLLFRKGTLREHALMNNRAQELADIPVMITFDGEWGLAMRLKGTPTFPRNRVLGCIQDNTLLYEYGKEVARQCREIGVHVTYLYNKRTDYPLNGPAFGINFRPHLHKNLNLIAEYDAKTFNVGATYALWADHFNFLIELQKGKYISAGLVYKVNLKGGNRWKSKLFDY